MENLLKVIKYGLSVTGGIVGALLGDIDGFISALILVMIVDYITGVMVAICENRLSSRIGARGIFKKIVIFMMVAIAHMVDKEILHIDGVLRTATIFFYLANEGLSIFENSLKLGLPVPDKLRDTFLQLQEQDKESRTYNNIKEKKWD